MQLKTSDSKFLKFGNAFCNTKLLYGKHIHKLQLTKIGTYSIYYAKDDIFIKEHIGITTITIGNSLKEMQSFILSKTIRINSNCYFYFTSLTDYSEVELYCDDEKDLCDTGRFIQFAQTQLQSAFDITELYFCSYSMKTAGYHFDSERHSCWELTYVDEGKLNTNIDGNVYLLQDNQYMFYVPNQKHSQDIPEDSNCSYLTIAFETNLSDLNFLENMVFSSTNELISIFDFFIQSDSHEKYINDYLKLKLKELIILTHNLKYLNDKNIEDRYNHKLLNSIIDYINENLNSELTIDQLCYVFGISRTTIQKIFQKHLSISPKSYIIDAKLSYSKILLKQNKYTVDEVAALAGFTTANYFSRMFKKRYGISPTQHSKSLHYKK